MRRFVIGVAAIAVLAAGTLVIGRTAPVDEEQAAKHADHALIAALGKGDQAAVRAFLDRHFTFTDRHGTTLSRREALKDFSALSAAASGTDGDVEVHFYGRMLTVPWSARGCTVPARFRQAAARLEGVSSVRNADRCRRQAGFGRASRRCGRLPQPLPERALYAEDGDGQGHPRCLAKDQAA